MSNADGTIYTLKLDNGTLAYKITESTGPTSTTTTPIAESFVKTWGGVNSDVGQSIVQTIDGGYAVAGYTYSYGAGNMEMYLLKFNANGNLEWNKTWGGSSSDAGLGVIQAVDGGYVVSGVTASYGAGSSDALLMKYDSGGNLVWNKLWGGAGDDRGEDLTLTIDGGYIVTGSAYSYGAGGL